MKTLVLGGTGFVGRRLVEILTADGAGVTVLNRGVTLLELPAGVTRLVADLRLDQRCELERPMGSR